MKNNLKRIFLLLLVLTMVPAAGAFAADKSYAAETEPESEIIDLYKLGILSDIPDETFRPDEIITRAEFAVWLAGAGMLNKSAVAGRYSDVSEDESYAPSVGALADAGIMTGNGDGNFYPDNGILTQEAVKSALSLLGYGQLADIKGGYPEGYIWLANSTELLDNVKSGMGAYMTRRDAAVMIYNMMFEKMYTVGGSNGNIIYEIDDDMTFLYYTRRIRKDTGIITENSVTGLEGGDGVNAGQLKINGVTYSDVSGNGQSLLGRKVEFYYEDDDSDYSVIYVKPAYKTRSVTLLGKNIESYAGNLLTCREGSNKNKYVISSTVDVVFNGKVTDYSGNDILFRDESGYKSYYGTIELFDNDNDGKYDLMDIHSYYNIIVSSARSLEEDDTAAAENFRITGKNGLMIDINSDTNYSISDKNGQKIIWTNLAEYDVLAVAESKDKKNISMIRCDDVVAGEITSITYSHETNDEKYTVMIEGSEYTIQRAMGYYCSDQSETAIGLTAGDKAFFTLDLEGKIALVKEKSINAGLSYGLIINYVMDESGDTLLIKLMKSDGNIVMLTSADKISIDGESYKTTDAILQRLTEVAGMVNGKNAGGTPLRKEIVVKYSLNRNGLLQQIDTPYLDGPGTDEDEQTLHIMKLQRPTDTAKATDPVSLIYRSNTFGGKIVVTSSTLFFYIPPVTSMKDDSYAVLPSSMLKIDSDHNIQAYTSNTVSQVPEAIMIHASPVYAKNVSEIDKGTEIAVYLKKWSGLDEEGDVKEGITVFQNGHEIKKCVDSPDIDNFRSLVTGDIIRYGTNGSANIDKIDVVYKFDKNKLPRQGLGNDAGIKNTNLLFTNGGARAIFGGVYGKEGSIIAVVNQIKQYQDGDTTGTDDGILVNDNMSDLSVLAQANIERYDISQYQIYRFDSYSGTVKTVTADDILAYQTTKGEYDYAVIYTVDYRPGIVILYGMDEVTWN